MHTNEKLKSVIKTFIENTRDKPVTVQGLIEAFELKREDARKNAAPFDQNDTHSLKWTPSTPE